MHTKGLSVDPHEVAGKFLMFRLAAEEYAIPILQVQEIIGMMDITQVPRLPDFVKGVINLRGKIIPVVDLRSRFAMPTVVQGDEACIIVVEVHGAELGVVVDAVLEVQDIKADDIDDPPSFGASVDAAYLKAVGKLAGRVQLILDIDCVLSTDELGALGVAGSQESGGALRPGAEP